MSRTCFEKHSDFNSFREDSKALFKDIIKRYENDKYGQNYLIYVCPGGWSGGQDINRVDISYGSCPVGRMVVEGSNNPLYKGEKIEADQGAWMMIYHYGDGSTLVSLFPAHTERKRRNEDEIILYDLSDPCTLHKKIFQKRLLRILKSYMATTCCLGKPAIWDWIRMGWIHIFKVYIIDGKTQKPLWLRAIARIISFIFQVGFSGFVVVLVLEKVFQYFIP